MNRNITLLLLFLAFNGQKTIEHVQQLPEQPDVPVIEMETAEADQVVLSFCGDISFAEGYANMNYYHSTGDDITKCLSPDLLSRMDAADIMMVNNEFTYGTEGAPLPGKTYTFRAKPESVSNLSAISADIVSLANNHVYDYGKAGLISTLETLEEAGIPYVGAGRNLDEAKNIVYFRAADMTIAYVSATQVERSYVFTKEATDDSAGVLRTYDPAIFLDVIKEAESHSDFVVVYVHWGTEKEYYFEKDQQELGHQYIDAGADLVIGSHTHRLQGVEYYNGVPIFYSLGNFWFNSSTIDTGLVEAVITKDGLQEFRFVPCIQKNCRTVLVTNPEEQQRIFNFLEKISKDVTITNSGIINSTDEK